jgi:hypothetical protein
MGPRLRYAIVAAFVAAAAWYLHDPPWAGTIVSGLSDWRQEPGGPRFRHSPAHASLFVPRDARALSVPLRVPGKGGAGATVQVTADDRWLADVRLDDPGVWVHSVLPLGARPAGRSYRRIEFRVKRDGLPHPTGIDIGEITIER